MYHAHFCSCDACFLHAFSSSLPQSTRLSMCSRSSSHVITPGVESGGMNPAQPEQLGYALTSLHISSQRPASLFCSSARRLRSDASQACSLLLCTTCLLNRCEDAMGSVSNNAMMALCIVMERRVWATTLFCVSSTKPQAKS